MAKSPTVREFMTADPCTVDAQLTLADAQDRMSANNIRHLLVTENDKVVGVVSTRDLHLAMSVRGADASRDRVAIATSSGIFAVDVDAPLADVAEQMEEHRYGCAVVTAGEDVVGIFTTTDALRAVRQLIVGAPVKPAVMPTHKPSIDQDAHAGVSLRVSDELRRARADRALGTFGTHN